MRVLLKNSWNEIYCKYIIYPFPKGQFHSLSALQQHSGARVNTDFCLLLSFLLMLDIKMFLAVRVMDDKIYHPNCFPNLNRSI